MHSPLRPVEWTSPARAPLAACSSRDQRRRDLTAPRGVTCWSPATLRWRRVRTAPPPAPDGRGPRPGSGSQPIDRCTSDTSRVEETRTAHPAGDIQSVRRRSTPSRKSRHHSWASQRAVGDIEGLVVDQQSNHLAVGHIDHRLPGFGVAVAGLRVRQGAQLVNPVFDKQY